ncbi:aminotransferase class I/II-fold pyridoxal phosphate-dependent enzyme [Guptibacillus hwajinpoensis]|uniref:aminotransferase class I/II-fold pyridoxal phosphate-dependent enzyme n=1 Tax=Guptibacillus hwajinpoensis TaxID=208199 RepID=UPI0037362E18
MKHHIKKAPLFEALTKWKEKEPVSFHVPGHKNGAVFSKDWNADQLYRGLLSIDATELSGLDDLHAAEGPIREAEQLTAEFYGSIDSRFLVGGSTAGNLAMLMGVCSEGDQVFVQKNCHKSVLNGLRLSKACPVFLSPVVDSESQVATGITIDTLRKALATYPSVKAIVLTNPNYYGMTIDLKPIISYAHEHGVAVLVDEAHGAHYAREPYFPRSAVQLGADLVVQSAHKTLPAMTMGSYLHVGNAVFRKAVNDYLELFQSSSPSYPIMGSLDLSRHYLSSLSDDKLVQIVSEINTFREQLKTLSGITVIEKNGKAYDQLDPLKITVQVRGLSGYELAAQLEKEGIFVELADPLNVLLVCPLASLPDHFEKARMAFDQIVSGVGNTNTEIVRHSVHWLEEDITFPAYSFIELETMNKEEVNFKKAAGSIAARAIIPYPPGIPIVMPGERISMRSIRMLETVIQGGGHVQGMNENRIEIAIEEE